MCIFRLVLRCLLVARKENLTGVSTGLTGRSKNLDPNGNPTGFYLCGTVCILVYSNKTGRSDSAKVQD